jgi:N-acetylglucosamine-6-sulfatase/uncharacterized sulfatase
MAIRYLKNDGGKTRKAGRPFALVVAMNPPHMPYNLVPKTYVAQYAGKTADQLLGDRPNASGPETRWGRYTRKNLKNYYAMITGVDDQFGRILQALHDGGLDRDTIVVFTSDHGDCLGLHDAISKNNHYEESMRVPFLIRWPGKIEPRRDDLLLSTPDIYPTLISLMGFADQIPKEIQGTNHARLFLTGDGPRPTSALYIKIPRGKPSAGRRGVRTHRYTLMIEKRPKGQRHSVLYDNREDPYQLHDIAAEQPAVVDRLTRDELIPWLKRTGDPWLKRGE